MTPEEAIEILDNEYKRIELQIMSLKGTIKENTESFRYRIEVKESLKTAITVLKEIQQYREIGTVEECREAVERQKPKKCIIDSCSDHAHYKCPSCGRIELSIYKHGFPRLGRITKYCPYCGQAIAENLEGMEDENT